MFILTLEEITICNFENLNYLKNEKNIYRICNDDC